MPNTWNLPENRYFDPDPAVQHAALELYLARNPSSPFKNRTDIISSPDIEKSYPPPNVTRYKALSPPFNPARYVQYVQAREELMISIAKVMADNKLDAIVHKSVEHEPSLIKNGINPPYETTRGVPTLNTFLIYAASMTVPFTRPLYPQHSATRPGANS